MSAAHAWWAASAGVPEGVPPIKPPIACKNDLLRVHTRSHLRMIHEFSSHGGQHFIGQNTYVHGKSFEVASLQRV